MVSMSETESERSLPLIAQNRDMSCHNEGDAEPVLNGATEVLRQ
jgi:hypothetical protein